MKKLMLSLALSGLMLTGFAQEKKDLKSDTKEMTAPLHKHSKDRKHDGLKNKNPEELAKIKTDRMDQKLKFTDQQRKEVYAFHLKQAQDHKKIAAERKLYREKMRKQRAADHEKMMGLLTPEQQKTLKDSYAENHRTHREHWKKDRQMRKGDFKKGEGEKVVDAEAKTT
ncbi:hypothetical protein D3C87_973960 [compost metagenome]|jgi:hypothetical protein|uniref:Spy/CpxP family protein refolding chaperone n=1 Tax=Sphingobacterium detergens TaxID=1145106 RepID=A0A420B7A3_SPHD1|nr:hypothetical protein [Sphingobacterium detergens]RKE52542.1 hypothetical protein DFQ12_2783 [Sphingobacterium detergens]